MEAELDFSPLLLVSALAFIIPFLTYRLTGGVLPAVVGEIIAGIFFGRSVLGIIEPHEWLEFLSLFGFAYLMFLSGLEINVALLLRRPGAGWHKPRVGLRQPLAAGLLMVTLVLVTTGIGVALIEWWGRIDNVPMLLFILAATAVGVVVPVLKDRGGAGAAGQAVLVSGFLLEFVAIVGIGVVASLERDGLGWEFFLILAMPAAFGLLLWSITTGRARFPVIPATLHELAHASSQLQIRAALAVLVMFVVLSQVVGTELVLGAFLAGLAVTILSPRHGSLMRVKLDALGYGFFVPIFFIMAGATLDLDPIFQSTDAFLVVPAFLAIAFVAKLLPAVLALGPGFGLRSAAAGGALLSANLSIILAAGAIALELELINEATNGALLMVAIITTVVAPLAFSRMTGPRSDELDERALVIGAGETGRALVPRLQKAGLQVTVVDINEETLIQMAVEGCTTVVGDASTTEILERAQACDAQVAVIATDSDRPERTREIAEALRALCPGLRIVTWVPAPDPHLELLEVEAHSAKEAAAAALGGAVLRPGLFQALGDADVGILEMPLRNEALHERSVRALGLPGGARILLVTREGASVVPDGDTPLRLNDQVTLGGEHEAVEEARDLLLGEDETDWLHFPRSGPEL